MKKVLLSFLLLGTCSFAFAQDDQYSAAMEKNVAALDSTHSPEGLQALENNFERIANVKQTEWLPYYYAGLCQVMLAFMEQDNSKVDALSDKAGELAAKSAALSKDNSEITCLQSMVASSRIKVDPRSRGMEFGMKSAQLLRAAQKLDTSNPRVYLLDGQGKFYTPEQYGGGKDAAKPILEEAVQKFASFKPAGALAPHWGEERAKLLLAQCSQ
ncbi:MAG TPA: hypothetical protein VIU45_01615 [Chitinophagaceae bacterium]